MNWVMPNDKVLPALGDSFILVDEEIIIIQHQKRKLWFDMDFSIRPYLDPFKAFHHILLSGCPPNFLITPYFSGSNTALI
jgi:hypothetical protein